MKRYYKVEYGTFGCFGNMGLAYVMAASKAAAKRQCQRTDQKRARKHTWKYFFHYETMQQVSKAEYLREQQFSVKA
jgi:hypothetical protein